MNEQKQDTIFEANIDLTGTEEEKRIRSKAKWELKLNFFGCHTSIHVNSEKEYKICLHVKIW